MKTNNLVYAATVIGASILAFIFLSVAITSVVFFLGGAASWIWTILSFLGAGSLAGWLLHKRGVSTKKIAVAVATFFVVVAGSIGVASYFVDASFDGNWYHKEAVGLMKEGWNPVYEKSGAFTYLYVDVYPKAAWIFAANVYSLTGNIESGKAYNLLLVIAVLLFAYGYLALRLNRNKALLLSGALALGTVMISQLQTYYVDGALGSILIILTIALNMLFDKVYKGPRRLLYAVIFVSIVLVGNLKFTGVFYAGIIIFVYWLYAVFMKDWLTWRRLTIVGLAGLVVAIAIVGAPTYIKNTITYGHPLHPIMGSKTIDIMTTNQPVTYGDKAGIYKFLESTFGESMNIANEKVGEFEDSPSKVPFTIKPRELETFSKGLPDVRQAGHGVWFGGVLILSVIAAGVLGLYAVKRKVSWKKGALIILPIIPVAITVLALQESWWARYVPQMIIIPVVLSAALFIVYKGKSTLPYILMFAVYVNIAVMATLYSSYNFDYTKKIHETVYSQLQCTEGASTQFEVHNMLALGSRYNVLDQCPGAVFSKASDSSEKPFWNDISRPKSQ